MENLVLSRGHNGPTPMDNDITRKDINILSNIILEPVKIISCDSQNLYNVEVPREFAVLDSAASSSPSTDKKSIAVPVIMTKQQQQQDSVIHHSSELSSPNNSQSNQDSFTCLKCKEQFDNFDSFRQHLKWHARTKSFTCPKCSEGFRLENNLKVHMITHHSTMTEVCPICKLSFHRKASLKSHMFIHRVEELILCDLCESEFESDGALLKHMESHGASKTTKISDKLVCPFCKMSFQISADYKQHIAKHVAVKKDILKGKKGRRKKRLAKKNRRLSFKCEFCHKIFPKLSLIERHKRIHTGEKPYKCHICNKAFAQSNSLKIHLDKHKGLKPYPCTLCPAKFTQKGNLRSHVEKTHTVAPVSETSKTYRCTHCTCVFKRVASLNGHVTKLHANEPTNDIDDHQLVIGQVLDGFKELTNRGPGTTKRQPIKDASVVKLVENHENGTLRRYSVQQKKIGDVRWYLCNYCSHRCKKPSDLIRHFRKHTLEKPYRCPECFQLFSLKTSLTNHMKIHEKCRQTDSGSNFACSICEKVFLTLEENIEHKLSHSSEVPGQSNVIRPIAKRQIAPKSAIGPKRKFQCPHCPRTFTTNRNLKRHAIGHKAHPNADRLVGSVGEEHIGNAASRLKCPCCDENFDGEDSLGSHLENKHTAKSDIANLFEAGNTVLPVEPERPLSESLILDGSNLLASDCQMLYLCDLPLNDPNLPLQQDEPTIFNELQEPDDLFLTFDNVVKPSDIGDSLVTDSANELLPAIDLTTLPVNVVNVPSESSAVIPADAQVICINCHKMFSNCYLFEKHLCAADDNININSDREDLKLLIHNEKPEENELFADSPTENTGLNLDKMKSFSFKKSLMEDIKKLEGSKQFNCKHCNFTTTLEDRYRKHLFLHPDLTDKVCKFCCKDFKKPSDLKRHLRTHTGERPFECEHCHKKFSLKSTLESHWRTHDIAGKDKISCEICHSNFATKSSLKVHMLLHTGERPHPCRYCDQSFRTLTIRKSHEKSRHLNNNNNKNKNAKTGNRATLEIKPNHGEELMIINPEQLNGWMSLDPKGWLDELQQANFIVGGEFLNGIQDSDVKQQTMANKRSKEVECDICRKIYSSKDALRKHKKTMHGQNKNFPCIKCDKGYDQLESLNKHIAKLHSGSRPYACQYCSNSFSEESSLKTHIKRIHQKSSFAQETTNALLALEYELSSVDNFSCLV